jgi:hypothetical protein
MNSMEQFKPDSWENVYQEFKSRLLSEGLFVGNANWLKESQAIHPIQRRIIEACQTKDISQLSLRAIGELVVCPHPQQIAHHLGMLIKKGVLTKSKKLKALTQSEHKENV